MENNCMQIFENEMFGSLRTVMIDGEPWFVGKDVAEALGYGNGNKNSKAITNAIADHVDERNKKLLSYSELKGYQNGDLKNISRYGATVINESGLYTLIFGSKLPSAKQFIGWVTEEVLPTIRRTGAYMMPFVLQKASEEPEYLQYIVDLLAQDKRRQLLITKETVKLHDEYHEWNNKVITPLLDGIATYEQVTDKLAVRKESYSALSLHYGYNVYYMRSEFIDEQMDIAKQNGIDINRSEFEVAFLYIIYINEACRNIYEDMLTKAFSNVQKMQKQLQEVIA